MPTYRITSPDGKNYEITAPEGATQEDALAYVQQHHESLQSQPEQPATREQQIRASAPGRFAAGMAEPMVGTGQLIAHGVSAVSPKGSYGEQLASIVDNYWKDQARKQEEAKKKLGVGTDVAGFAGNVMSPVNALLAAKGINAATTLGKMGQGAVMGAASGATQPVLVGDYATEKGMQTGLGAVMGGAFAGIIDKLSGKSINKISRAIAPEDDATLAATAAIRTDEAMKKAFADAGIDPSTVSASQVQAIRDQVMGGLKSGKELDAAALMRKADFDALNIPPLQGQITRDPLQFAQERNMRGAVPEIAERLNQQGQVIRGQLQNLSGDARNNYEAGNTLIEALKTHDERLRGNVSSLYQQARESAGKDLNIPLQGLAQDYAQVLNDFGDKIPSGVRKNFEDYGLLTGKQLKTFTVEDADKLLKVINDNVSNDPAANKALGSLRNAVKSSVTSVDDTGGVFAPAVKAAADRFKLQEAIPALKASAEGNASPDSFVNKFIINGKTDETTKFAQLLRDNFPDQFNEAKRQLGATLERAAYGENPAGDSSFTPDRFAKILRSIGTNKLSAFYDPSEIDSLNRLARVGAYIDKIPAVSPVNTSNTATANFMNNPLISGFIGAIPGKGAVVGAAKAATGAVKNQMAASNAMNAEIPSKAVELTPAQRKIVERLLGIGSVGSGVFGSSLLIPSE